MAGSFDFDLGPVIPVCLSWRPSWSSSVLCEPSFPLLSHSAITMRCLDQQCNALFRQSFSYCWCRCSFLMLVCAVNLLYYSIAVKELRNVSRAVLWQRQEASPYGSAPSPVSPPLSVWPCRLLIPLAWSCLLVAPRFEIPANFLLLRLGKLTRRLCSLLELQAAIAKLSDSWILQKSPS